MNIEILEHELHQLNGKGVVIVRPYYGNQSDSWTGLLTTISHSYPLKFHFVVDRLAIIFTADDAVKIEDRSPLLPIIRLKGPQDYLPRIQTVKA